MYSFITNSNSVLERQLSPPPLPFFHLTHSGILTTTDTSNVLMAYHPSFNTSTFFIALLSNLLYTQFLLSIQTLFFLIFFLYLQFLLHTATFPSIFLIIILPLKFLYWPLTPCSHIIWPNCFSQCRHFIIKTLVWTNNLAFWAFFTAKITCLTGRKIQLLSILRYMYHYLNSSYHHFLLGI